MLSLNGEIQVLIMTLFPDIYPVWTSWILWNLINYEPEIKSKEPHVHIYATSTALKAAPTVTRVLFN